MSVPSIVIRPLAASDQAVWKDLWTCYLVFYKSSVAEDVYETTWSRLLDPDEPLHGLFAEVDGKIVGLVHYLFHRSTWSVGNYCYLQDLFVEPDVRGKSVGRHLIQATREAAEAAGASRVYWTTQEHNQTARVLYDKVADLTDFLQYRIMLDG